MPCCMMGAIILGQWIAGFEWIRRLFRRSKAAIPCSSESKPRKRRWRRWLIAVLILETFAFGTAFVSANELWYRSRENTPIVLSAVQVFISARCGAHATSKVNAAGIEKARVSDMVSRLEH